MIGALIAFIASLAYIILVDLLDAARNLHDIMPSTMLFIRPLVIDRLNFVSNASKHFTSLCYRCASSLYFSC